MMSSNIYAAKSPLDISVNLEYDGKIIRCKRCLDGNHSIFYILNDGEKNYAVILCKECEKLPVFANLGPFIIKKIKLQKGDNVARILELAGVTVSESN